MISVLVLPINRIKRHKEVAFKTRAGNKNLFHLRAELHSKELNKFARFLKFHFMIVGGVFQLLSPISIFHISEVIKIWCTQKFNFW